MYQKKTIESDWSKEQIIDLIYETGGRLSHVAKRLHCDRRTVYSFVERHPEVEEMIAEARRLDKQASVDDAESYVYSIAERYKMDTTNGLKAAIYCLETHGRDRGWGKASIEENEKKKADELINATSEYANKRAAESQAMHSDQGVDG